AFLSLGRHAPAPPSPHPRCARTRITWSRRFQGGHCHKYREVPPMRSASSSLAAVVTAFLFAAPAPLHAQAEVALTGVVSSAEEGAMEGVLVSAKKVGSTITITVVSDKDGRYSFPAAKLEPGTYALRIRAVGYDLDNHKAIDVAAQRTTTLDLKLRKTEDLAAQLSNAEWMASVP